MKVKELYAILRREPAHWESEIAIEVETPSGAIRLGELCGLRTDLEDPDRLILSVRYSGAPNDI